ncbi:hypothetical protein F7725_010811 [Dissostichus mawsoni]|uniref:Ig-like domain-containing protein n=1 Tax=Dissostichus mawsoni TaxID=36200 RepID=A0A7J5Z7N7_DISMA|nr:hypothetical protein F7725_010811 [Dissostichus mawsoni]
MNHSHFAALGSMNSIKPERSEEHVAEGRNISLTCKYEGTIYNIQWYRQYQRSRPEFLLYITEAGVIHPTESDFSAHIDKTEKRVDLEIISAAVTDSAVYYCALRPTVTGNTTLCTKTFGGKTTQYCTTSTRGKCKGEDTVKQTAGDVRATEGDTVTLDCTFKISVGLSAYLFCYKQEANDLPLYILRQFHEDRFDATLNETSVPLQISSAVVTDSAVYYFALQPTVTGNNTTLYKNLWSRDNTILINIHQREPLSCKGVDTVTQPAGDVRATEGGTVTLGCKFQTSTTAYLFWYKQEVNGYPKYMLSVTQQLDDRLCCVLLCSEPTVTGNTTTLYKNLWSKDNTILHSIHQREPLSTN